MDTLGQYLDYFRSHGGTAEGYLADHFGRFVNTLEEFDRDWKGGRRVLDIGSHWLHQAVLWSRAGYSVTGVEFPDMVSNDMVVRAAAASNISLHGCSDLASANDLLAIPDNSADIILFAEIIEHITFNPIHLWTQLYRILSPGGCVLVTTPNYYSWKGRAWQPLRFISGNGGGISVNEILGIHTHGHHWREYSLKEMKLYFRKLSPDFRISKAKLVRTYTRSATPWKAAIQASLDVLPILRPNMHIEVRLPEKKHGIVAKAHW